ncbi:uncharacterized protein [Palaemon carinicauda]|uniref:uncharacterized protein n=1 Tax=Palaemon carinicauda TaxID=392227 RepID=UPI0035B5C502
MGKGHDEMNQLIGFRLDRMIKPEDSPGDPQLHGFSDASESALGSSLEERFTELSSDWNRLVRITAYCHRLLLQQDLENCQSHLEPKEIQEAELALFYASQKSLKNQDEVNHKQTKKLDQKLDEKGILRIGGRLHKLHLPYEQRHPVLLVRNSSLAEAFAQMIHRCTGHKGYRVAIALAFKRGVYIIGGARLFQDIAFKCCFCRTRRHLLLGQQMGELPNFRGESNTPTPFSRVALDFFGPIKIKLTHNTSTEGTIMIITCTVTRVISLELVDSLSSDAFLCAWRRFTCNHVIHPVLAVSDRGRNFIRAQEKLQK